MKDGNINIFYYFSCCRNIRVSSWLLLKSTKQMKNKTEFTDEDVARRLGWEWKLSRGLWFLPNGEQIKYCPEFKEDLNAAWKYVWPEYYKRKFKILSEKGLATPALGMGPEAVEMLNSQNPALYLCQKFMSLEGDKL